MPCVSLSIPHLAFGTTEPNEIVQLNALAPLSSNPDASAEGKICEYSEGCFTPLAEPGARLLVMRQFNAILD